MLPALSEEDAASARMDATNVAYYSKVGVFGNVVCQAGGVEVFAIAVYGEVAIMLGNMDQEELAEMADNWIKYWHAAEGSPVREEYWEATDLYELEQNDPETLWLLILAIHARDQSVAIQQVLSAGPIEDLLAKHGEKFIDRVEAETRNDPQFAKVFGGVWKIA